MFKPNLAPNEQPKPEDIIFPKFASTKLDGIRCVFKGGEMLSRSLKQIQSKQLQEKFKHIKQESDDSRIIFDGELYAHGRSFQTITKAVMSQDIFNKTSIKRIIKEQNCSENEAIEWAQHLIDDIQFFCFDSLDTDFVDETFKERQFNIRVIMKNQPYVTVVEQVEVNSWEEVQTRFKVVLDEGYEGLMLKDKDSTYKFGRNTLKENVFFKVKPYVTVDMKVTGFVQATEVREGAEKKVNELGRSVTSKKKNDRVPVDMASGVVVDWKGVDLKVNLSQTHDERKEIWNNKDKYLGQYIEFKYLDVGMKDLPRHPTSIRWRFDKND